jgi:hypothetical protein
VSLLEPEPSGMGLLLMVVVEDQLSWMIYTNRQ